jgi:hypothetical protein
VSHTEEIMSEGLNTEETISKSHHPPCLPHTEWRTISSPKSNMLFGIQMDTIGTQHGVPVTLVEYAGVDQVGVSPRSTYSLVGVSIDYLVRNCHLLDVTLLDVCLVW